MTRADALRNRARVVDAATKVFAERGLDACVDEIAARAGVGKATVYRSFPTKEHLVAAVACRRLEWFAALAEEACGAADAWAAFEHVLVTAAEAQAQDLVLSGSMEGQAVVAELAQARAAAHAALERLMARAREQGTMAPEATAEEVRTLFSGVSRILGGAEERDPAVWRRHARLVATAFRR